MRIASFNVRHGTSRAGRLDLALFARACAGLGADVLALQEVDHRVARSHWANLTVRAARAVGSAQGVGVFGPACRLGLVGRYGNALIVRGDVAGYDVVALPCRRGHERRSAIAADVDIAGQRLSVVATHLSTAADEAIEQLGVALETLGALPVPRLLLGDLNLTTESIAAMVEDAGLTLAGGGPTFPANAPQRRIDHVAVEGLELADARTVDAGSSDHLALVAEVGSGPPPV